MRNIETLIEFINLKIATAEITSSPSYYGFSWCTFRNQLGVDVSILHVFFHL